MTLGDPYVTTEEHTYDLPGNPTPNGSATRAMGRFNPRTVRVVAFRIRGCPTPPASSIVRTLHGYGVGLGHTEFPHGHICTTIFVHDDGCGVNVSPCNIIGIPFTKTVSLSGGTGKIGISGKGGHQQVLFLILILLGVGGLEHPVTS
jgi:hypothetical protein